MSSMGSSLKPIDKVSSDNLDVGFDLLSNLTYMSVLSLGSLPRDQVLEHCACQRFKTAVFFDFIYLMAKRVGMEYTRAFQLAAEKARASSIKSLLLRFAASISSGESEREFMIQEAQTEGERYGNEYERSVENLRKWTDAYAAILISVTLIMVVSLVSTMMGSLGQNFIVIMGFALFFITGVGVFIIYKVAPVEQITYDADGALTPNRKKARRFLALLGPVGIAAALVIAPQFELMMGSAIAFLAIGVSLLPAGWYAWKDDGSVSNLDTEFPTFIRSVGNIAGASGVTLTEALKRIDTKSMGSLEPHIDRLNVRLAARLPTQQCWEAFRAETGSELVKRTTHMMEDGAELGGQPDQVGNICSSYALKMVQLRAKRALTASTFSFLTLPMHATMTFILVFVLEIISNFNAKLSSASAGLDGAGSADFAVPDGLAIPPGVSLPAQGELAGGLDLFGNQDMGLVTLMIVVVVVILTIANSLAPKAAAGGSHLKIVSYFALMSLVSGFVLAAVPVVTGKIFCI
ncbi:MAG: type II secretion system F family protein [Chloroflexi bacterium]|nr:type II secretion system F family protein [Chloroflexota bacterium]MDA1270993.1 type II secretion system F family protein [Chloroflexota bacterium]PKB58258.1 MAG: hypothetical protein BZY83_08035 [SAR202 cluster bacterium Casp-Chloro-G2]